MSIKDITNEEIEEAVGKWVVCLDTLDDGVQVYTFNTIQAATEFGMSQADDLRFIMDKLVYLFNMKEAVEHWAKEVID